jgi:hypothetical protein
VGWICQTIIIFGLPYDPELYFNPKNVAKVFFWIFACLPWCPLSKAVLDLAAATGAERDPGRPSLDACKHMINIDRPCPVGISLYVCAVLAVVCCCACPGAR